MRGLVKVKCDTDSPELLNGPLFTKPTGTDVITLTMKNSMGKYWLAEVDGVTDRTAAEKLRGTKLWVERDQLPDLEDEDEFYFEDLIGLTAEDQSGKPAGKVLAVENFGAGDLLEIKPPQGASYYLPFTKETVPVIALDQGKLVIVPPENGDA